MNDAATSFKECPKCGTPNPQIARFCSHCRAAFGDESHLIPPPPTPLPNKFQVSENSVTLEMDAATAYEQAVEVIQAGGGQILSSSPPSSARFHIKKRKYLDKGKYNGTLSVSPTGAGRSICHIDLKLDWNSRFGQMVIGSGLMLMGIIFLTIFLHPYFLLILFLVPIFIIADAWSWSTQYRNGFTKEILKDISSSAAQVGSGSLLNIQQPTQNSPIDKSVRSSEADTHLDIAERIRKLDSLLKEKLITQKEYDEKKAELLKKL